MVLYSEAYLSGEDEWAYRVLTERCRAEIGRQEFTALVQAATYLYANVTMESYTDDVNGDVATATYEFSDPSLNQAAERWIFENGGWRNDDC